MTTAPGHHTPSTPATHHGTELARRNVPRAAGHSATGSFDTEIRKIVCSTNAIESLNARFRRAVNARGHFPNEAAALKVLYLVVTSLDPTGKGRARWSNRWKAALNAFDITFDGRISTARR